VEELAKCFDTRDNLYKQTELLILADVMGHDNTLK
jgi:hypothetical protein